MIQRWICLAYFLALVIAFVFAIGSRPACAPGQVVGMGLKCETLSR